MDTRNLHRRRGLWHVDFTIPGCVLGQLGLGKARFRLSLKTAEYQTARNFRDRFVLPLIREVHDLDILTELAHKITRLNRRVEEQLDGCLAQAGVRLDKANRTRQSSKPGVTLRQLADEYLSYLSSATDLAPGSVRKYRATLAALCSIVGDDADPEVLSKDDIAGFRDALLRMPVGWQTMKSDAYPTDGKRTISPASARRDLQRIRGFFRWAVAEGKLRRSDIPGEGVTCERIRTKHKECPTPEEVEKLLALPCPRNADGLSWQYMPTIARYSGCRIGEIAALRAEDIIIDHDIRCFQVRGTHVKTESSERVVPIADRLGPSVDELLRIRPHGRIFPECGDWTGPDGFRKAAHYFLKAWNRAAKTAGPFSFHCWRVYANNEMVRGEVDIIDRERILGHRNTRTQGAYTATELDRYLKALNKIR